MGPYSPPASIARPPARPHAIKRSIESREGTRTFSLFYNKLS